MTRSRSRLQMGAWLTTPWLAAAVAAVVAAGCTATGQSADAPSIGRTGRLGRIAAPSIAPRPAPVAFQTGLDVRDLQQMPVARWWQPARIPARTPAGARLTAAAVGPDGAVVAVEQADRGRLLLLTGEGAPVALPGTAGSQIRYVDVSRRWVAWTESRSHDYFSDRWTLHIYDRRSGETRVAATAPRVPGHGWPTVPDGSVPVIDGDTVVIAQAVEVDDGRTVADVVRVPCRGGRAHTLVHDAVKPVVAGGRLVYARVGWAFRGYRLLVDGHVLARGRTRLTGMAAGARWIAWSDGRGVWLRRRGHTRVKVLDRPVLDAMVAVQDQLIGSVPGPGGATTVALDVTDGRWRRLGRSPGSGLTWTAGRRVLRDETVRARVRAYRLGVVPRRT